MTNTILVKNSGVWVESGGTAILEGTLWGSGAWANESDWSGDDNIITGTVNSWGDPAFVDPDHGDYHIGAGSAAINAGVDARVPVSVHLAGLAFLDLATRYRTDVGSAFLSASRAFRWISPE